MSRGKQWLAAAAGALALVGGGAAVLLTSDGVLRWLVARQQVQSIVNLSPADVRGDLLGPILISEIEIPAIGLTARNVELRHRLFSLLAGRLAIEKLDVESLRLDPPNSEEPGAGESESSASFSLPQLPVDIALGSARVSRLVVVDLPDPLSRPAALTLDTFLYSQAGIELEKGTLVGDGFRADLSGSLPLQPRNGDPLALAFDASIERSADPRLDGAALGVQAVGALPRVQLEATASGPAQASYVGEIVLVNDQLTLSGALRFSELHPALLAPPQLAGLAGELEVDGALPQFALAGTVALPELFAEPVTVAVDGGWAPPRLSLERVDLSLGPARASGTAALTTGPAPEVAVTLDWQRLDSLLDSGGIELSAGWLDVRGPLQQLTLRGRADIRPLPDIELAATFDGSLTPAQVALDGLELAGDIGRFAGAARFVFDAGRGEVEGALESFNPGLIWPEYGGSIDAEWGAGVVLEDPACAGCMRVTGTLGSLSGELRGMAASVQGQFSVDVAAGDLTGLVARGRGRWGGSEAVFDVAGEQVWQGNWSLEVADLENYGLLAGRLTAQGTLEGPFDVPAVRLEVEAADLALPDTRIGGLSAKGRIESSDWAPQQLELQATGLEYGQISLASLNLGVDATGSGEDRRVELNAESELGTVSASGVLRTTQDGWSGRIDALTADLRERDAIDLRAPAEFAALRDGTGELSTTCLAGADLEACFSGSRSAGVTAFELALSRLDLALLSALEIIPLNVEGNIGGGVDLAVTTEGIAGRGEFRAGPGRVRDTFGTDAANALLRWRSAVLTLEADAEGGASLAVNADLPGADAVEAALAFTGPAFERLDGTVTARTSQLGLLSASVPQVSGLEGNLLLDLGISGQRNDPQISGRLTLENAALTLPDLGVRWSDVAATGELAWSADSPTLEFTGSGQSGDGGFQAKGTINGFSPLAADIQLEGSNLLLVDRPEARLVTDAKLDLALSEPVLAIGGNVAIPKGELRAAPVTVVEASPDERIIGVVEEDFETSEWQIRGRIKLTLGDELSVDASGLKAMLAGNLTVRLEPEGNITGRGEIQLKEATYEAFRQTLEIDRGELRFSGGPVDNPALDFRAVRQVDAQTVGLQVRGVLKDPQLDLFSDPALSRAETLSYLTLGRSLATASEGEQQILGDAAASAAIGSGNFVAEELGRRLGLDSRLEGNLDNASLVLGKYLSPKLYVSYGIGLFAAVDTLRLRYQLSRHLALQAESGDEEGADLIYTLEK